MTIAIEGKLDSEGSMDASSTEMREFSFPSGIPRANSATPSCHPNISLPANPVFTVSPSCYRFRAFWTDHPHGQLMRVL
ncbi:hypothetical protein IG631_12739 [Alternaria alternata]|nr:hypothetical protein IG631_12739 [Alternaria alternata]